jgi:hypothetical protein
MNARSDDRQAITDLMTGWIHRDLAEWNSMRDLFHPDATIEILWFSGLAYDFIGASEKMGASRYRAKHVIGNPVITFNGDKALVETNAVIVGESLELALGCNAHNRFWDRVEKRDGAWRISRRESIYDSCLFTFPIGLVDVDRDAAATYPREYAALAYLLERSGFPVTRVYATKGSDLEREMKDAGRTWLAS